MKFGNEFVDRTAAGAEANIDSRAMQPLFLGLANKATDEIARVQCQDKITKRLCIRAVMAVESCRSIRQVDQQDTIASGKERTEYWP